ncbi:unnamed protein product [Nezara viridula]|uniref:Nuclear inhibitor of protein phosphatase 1 n=1 Tax=Nezara viridula TaxID=85310 RepID=A0A9P0E7I0_NEZVI|nr:unnamed protein product [Nezara viridula]
MANHYDIPTWAGKPPVGTHLDVMKEDKLVQNLTEFNTAHNRRISMLGIGSAEAEAAVRPKRRRRSVTFSEEEEVINPEDVDPSVGRFRDMVHTTVIPTKRNRFDGIGPTSGLTHEEVKFVHLKHFSHPTAQLYTDLPHPDNTQQQSVSLPQTSSSILSSVLASRLGISLPNPAPEVEMIRHVAVAPVVVNQVVKETDTDNSQPKKKKYAKESWPGKKTVPTLLV